MLIPVVFGVDGSYDPDYPPVQGTILMIAVSYIVVNWVMDIIYSQVDP